MATINIPGRVRGESYILDKVEGTTDTWLDLTFRNIRTGKNVEVKLAAHETYQIVNHKPEKGR